MAIPGTTIAGYKYEAKNGDECYKCIYFVNGKIWDEYDIEESYCMLHKSDFIYVTGTCPLWTKP